VDSGVLDLEANDGGSELFEDIFLNCPNITWLNIDRDGYAVWLALFGMQLQVLECVISSSIAIICVSLPYFFLGSIFKKYIFGKPWDENWNA